MTTDTRPTLPVPGYEDLFPHISVLDRPGDPLHGEVIVPPRTLGLLLARDLDEFNAEWERQLPAMRLGVQKTFNVPKEWQPGARRRSNELMARYNTMQMFEVMRGLHREHGVFPAGIEPEG
ncbi:hypothetical protein JYK22_05150, partial [Nonomuraea sp. RK-328]|nr:hypothetical protein [Nonomuraea sp. RK-328]